HGDRRRTGGGVAGAFHRDAPVVAALLEDETLAEGRRDGDELRVDRRTVEALVVVLDQDLPVGPQLGDRAVRTAQLVHPPRLVQQRLVALLLERLPDTLLRLAEMDEDEALPDVDVHGPERKRRAVEPVGPYD